MLQVIYQDKNLIAVNKPSGLLSVPGKTEPDCLYTRVLSEFPNARVVHRLDMGTSGIILFALSYDDQKSLSKQFEQRKVIKNYIASVNGIPQESTGEIQAPLICDWPNRPKQKVDWVNGKHAVTYYKILEKCTTQNTSRVLLIPHTGRSHQLRVHMQFIGHPIVGDRFYSDQQKHLSANRLRLHAQLISFFHPKTQIPLTFTCEPDF